MKKFFKACISVLFFLSIIILYNIVNPEKISLEIYSPEHDDVYSMFYNSGKGYNENKVLNSIIITRSGTGTVNFPLPCNKIKSLLIVLGTGGNSAGIKSITAGNMFSSYTWLPGDIIKDFNFLPGSTGLDKKENILYVKSSEQRNPCMELVFNDRLNKKIQDILLYKIIFYILALLLSAGLYVLLPVNLTVLHKIIMSCSFLFILTVIVFSYTVKIRQPWCGSLSYGHHQWITGSTIKFTKMWLKEGPEKLKFAMLDNPASAEFPTLMSRGFYGSYPPGTLFPVYILSKITGSDVSPSMVMKYNLFNHFLIALCLSLTVFFFLLRLGFNFPLNLLLSSVPVFIELLLPAPLYWHQNVYFSDQAVILPSVIFIFLEIIKKNISNKTLLITVNAVQSVIFFYGTLTDWFFYFIALAVYIKRIFDRETGTNIKSFIVKSLLFWLPAISSLFLFALQLSAFNGWERLIFMGLLRTGLSEQTPDFYKRFWHGYMFYGYGFTGIYLLWSCLLLFLILFLIYSYKICIKKEVMDKNTGEVMSVIGMFLIPYFLQIYCFKQHSLAHDFSTLKFSVPLSVVPFVLIPVLLFVMLKQDKYIIKYLFTGIMCCIAVIYIITESHKFIYLYPAGNKYDAEIFISEHTGYEDIVFSPCYEIPSDPPQKLSCSMKRVYREWLEIKDKDIEILKNKITPKKEIYVKNLLNLKFPLQEFENNLRRLNFYDEEIKLILSCATTCRADVNTDIYNKVKDIKENYYINIFLIKSDDLKVGPDTEKLIMKADKVIEDDRYILYKISRDKFLSMIKSNQT